MRFILFNVTVHTCGQQNCGIWSTLDWRSDVVQGWIFVDVMEVLYLVRITEVWAPSESDGEFVEPQHVMHTHSGLSCSEQGLVTNKNLSIVCFYWCLYYEVQLLTPYFSVFIAMAYEGGRADLFLFPVGLLMLTSDGLFKHTSSKSMRLRNQTKRKIWIKSLSVFQFFEEKFLSLGFYGHDFCGLEF